MSTTTAPATVKPEATDMSSIWGLTPKHEKTLKDLRAKNGQDLTSWTVFTIVLPLVTFLFAAGINLLYTSCIYSTWGKMFNNGSLPIIAFGILSSAVPYLVEKIQLRQPEESEVYDLRKRTLAFAVVLLFITAGLFIVQSINFVENTQVVNTVLLVFAVVATILAVKVGRVMFLLQSAYANTFQEDVGEKVDAMKNDLQKQFGILDDE
jgi:hypothetical protein